MSQPNADFIAHARTDLPAALDEIARLRAELAKEYQGKRAVAFSILKMLDRMNVQDPLVESLRQELAK